MDLFYANISDNSKAHLFCMPQWNVANDISLLQMTVDNEGYFVPYDIVRLK